jgi:hypothetical protein
MTLAASPWRDPWYGFALFAALPAVVVLATLTPLALTLRWPGMGALVMMACVLPLLEEIVFRIGLHDALSARLSARLGHLTFANGLTAGCFALAHLLHHPPAWALATGLPALVFGALWERHGRLFVPISVHAAYNAAYLCLLGAPAAVS